MPNALIFSPDLDGHRQVYVFVIADILQELGFNIIIAGNKKQRTTNSFYIDKLQEKPKITFVDTSSYTGAGLDISLSEFLGLQNRFHTQLTIFPEADNHMPLLISSAITEKRKLKGRVVAIFMRPFYYYRKKLFLDKLRFLKHLNSRWNKDEQLFYEFFLKRFHLVDVALSVDENYVSSQSNFKWLPDVFQEYADKKFPVQKSDQRIWVEKLNKFKERNTGRFLVLYFGTSQKRRGYDTLLKLTNETESCFIHCGLRDENIFYDHDVNEIRSILKKEGRLFETNEYIEDALCIEYFFKSITHLILPYKNFFGSSGIMLQALNLGIPILSCENGIIGDRIKKYNLGRTFNENCFLHLKKEFNSFKKTDPETFAADIKSYMDFQSVQQLKNSLINAFINGYYEVKVPF